MDSTGTIWVALDCDKNKALTIAKLVAPHKAVAGFKINRLVDQEVFRKDDEPMMLWELADAGNYLWVDLKFHDIPNTVASRVAVYAESGLVTDVTVMAKGGVDMMMAAVEAGGDQIKIIAVTELTSLSEEQVHLLSGHSAKASVINLARLAVLSGIRYLVCSGQELKVINGRPELNCLFPLIPAVKPAWSLRVGDDQKRVVTVTEAFQNRATAVVIGRAIIDANDPLEAVEKTAAEIEAI